MDDGLIDVCRWLQGTAADLMKLALCNIRARIAEEQCNAHVILQIHDEVLFDVSADELPKVAAIVRDCMVGCVAFTVPLAVSLSSGNSWGSLRPLSL